MTEPFFSIVIANYNHGQFLEGAILSVLNQSIQDFELIIVDGGSDDNSIDVIEKYKSRLSWWCSEKDNGQSAAFNKGFARATGRFFTWLNADDLLLPRTFEKVRAKLLQNPQCQWLAGNTIFFNERGEITRCSVGPEWVSWIAKRVFPYVYGPTSFFARELFRINEGFDETFHYGMDTDLWGKFVANNASFKRLRHFCWAFRIHEQSKTSHAFDRSPLNDFKNERKKLAERYEKNHTRGGRLALRGLKLITAYPVSLFYLLRWKGRKITDYIAQA